MFWSHNSGVALVVWANAETRSHNYGRALYARMTPLRLSWLLFLAKREKVSNEWLGELRGKL